MILSLLGRGPGRSRRPSDLIATLAFVAGGALVIWSGAIHLDLWDSGYRNIPTIGNLFLAQFIGGLVVGLVVIATRRLWGAIVGIGFALSTIAGFLISVERGLFGFQDSWSAPFATQAFAIEVAIAAVFLIAGALCLAPSASTTTGATPLGSPS